MDVWYPAARGRLQPGLACVDCAVVPATGTFDMPKRQSADRELQAMQVILRALNGLDGEAIQRVLDYVFGRLSSSGLPRASSVSISPPYSSAPTAAEPSAKPAPSSDPAGRRVSIRDLKDQKRPNSSNQMAALVAYYLTEIEHAQDTITTEDVKKYFKQAGFALPEKINQTLPNATSAGYFDSIGEGRYRLNPVGYNLVVHALPRTQGGDTSSRRKKPSKRSKKKSKRS